MTTIKKITETLLDSWLTFVGWSVAIQVVYAVVRISVYGFSN